MLVSPLLLSNEANAKTCTIPSFHFRVISQGPWPAHMTFNRARAAAVAVGALVASSSSSIFRALPATARSFSVSFPGRYDYTPSPGYLGDDTFTLKICGVVNGGFEGCADLLFSVNVVPPGI